MTVGEDAMPLAAVCVFCGSNPGRTPVYLDAVAALARTLAGAGIRLVYGGASVGTMGALADGVLAAGGEVVGVIPEQQVGQEIAHEGLTRLHVVGSMHERKAAMAELSDGFVALPGGLGTLEEFAEIVTWSQLGLHDKPTGLLNTAGYYDGLLAFLDHAVDEMFLRPADRELVLVGDDPVSLLDRMRDWTPGPDRRWAAVDAAPPDGRSGTR